jgi:trimeric autotransporter adhesin
MSQSWPGIAKGQPMTSLCAFIAAGVAACSAGFALAQECQPEWGDGFPSGYIETDQWLRTLANFDDGSGPAVYAGLGSYNCCDEGLLPGIVRWDGYAWIVVGGGVETYYGGIGDVHAMAVLDDGSGPALYAAGEFAFAGGKPASGIARWDGGAWAEVGGGIGDNESKVRALLVYDDGSGPALYAGGSFASAGGDPASGIARWDGTQWSPVGLGVVGEVYALAAFDGGDGPRLYAGGTFSEAGGNDAAHIAAWDGNAWAPLGDGVDGDVFALGVFDDGGGSRIYAGGYFLNAGGAPAAALATWDGAAWSAMDQGVFNEDRSQPGEVYAFRVFDDGSGPTLYIGGSFHFAGDAPAVDIARWNGTRWTDLGDVGCGYTCAEGVYALLPLDSPDPTLAVGGSFTSVLGRETRCITTWTAAGWAPFGTGADGRTYALATGVEGSTVYIGGDFAAVGGIPSSRVARLDVEEWSSLGDGISGPVYALAFFDEGAGPVLFAGGEFAAAGGGAAANIARWDGQEWSDVGGGTDGIVRALAVYDDGLGPALYATGRFETAGGLIVSSLARWDGKNWSAVGGGLQGVPQNGGGFCLEVFDDGDGQGLYVAGRFTALGEMEVNHIARWDGAAWTVLGPGLTWTDYPPYVRALQVFDDGSGPALYAGGQFDRAGALVVNAIARWDGASWSSLGDGLDNDVYALATFDDGSGLALYASGPFENIVGGESAAGVAAWDGAVWRPLGLGIGAHARGAMALATRNSDQGGTLWLGGDFLVAGGKASARIARYDGCPAVCQADCDGSGALDLLDYVCFSTLFNAQEPGADCDASGALDLFDFLCFVNAFNEGC